MTLSLATPQELALMALISMGLFSDSFIVIIIWLTFRRHSGLYFWALNAIAITQILVCVSTYLSTWVVGGTKPAITLTLNSIGNTGYVLAEFLVLWSRLHLLQASRRQLKLILGIILAEWMFVEIPLMILSIIATLRPSNTLATAIYFKWFDVESCLYLIVDVSLSVMYFHLISRNWGKNRAWKRVHANLVGMMILLLCIDATYILLVFSKSSQIILGITLFSFSLKLPIELYALNMLTELSKSALHRAQQEFGASDMECSGGSVISQRTAVDTFSTEWESGKPEVRKVPEPLLPE